MKKALEGGWTLVVQSVDWAFAPAPWVKGVLLILISGVLIYGGLISLVRLLRSRLKRKAASVVKWALDRTALVGMSVGLVVTIIIQSSSVTTSLLVPLAGAGFLTLERAFPVVLGANLGTTMTALLAALAITGPNSQAGLTIAIVHLLYNLTGILVIYGIPALRKIPLAACRWTSDLAVVSVRWALLYVILLFYGVPLLAALLTGLLSE